MTPKAAAAFSNDVTEGYQGCWTINLIIPYRVHKCCAKQVQLMVYLRLGSLKTTQLSCAFILEKY